MLGNVVCSRIFKRSSLTFNVFRSLVTSPKLYCSNQKVQYVQGQSPQRRIREYFYYIDHQGMLFLDDARIKNFTSCFKEKAFLQFFFKRIRLNEMERYPEFPFLSPCGRERNFIRCDDIPIVFTHIVEKEMPSGTEYHLAYGNAGDLMTHPFEPSKLCMEMSTGRVYHPAMEHGGSVGLVRSQLAIQLSNSFIFQDGEDNPPSHITWEGNHVPLSHELANVLVELEDIRKYSMGLAEDI